MRKVFPFFILLTVVLLSACGGGQTQPPAAAENPTATVPVVVQSPATQVATQPPVDQTAVTTTPTLAPIVASGPANCTVQSALPSLDPTQASLFPAVSDKDWVDGPPNAKVTILEYSDFQ